MARGAPRYALFTFLDNCYGLGSPRVRTAVSWAGLRDQAIGAVWRLLHLLARCMAGKDLSLVLGLARAGQVSSMGNVSPLEYLDAYERL